MNKERTAQAYLQGFAAKCAAARVNPDPLVMGLMRRYPLKQRIKYVLDHLGRRALLAERVGEPVTRLGVPEMTTRDHVRQLLLGQTSSLSGSVVPDAYTRGRSLRLALKVPAVHERTGNRMLSGLERQLTNELLHKSALSGPLVQKVGPELLARVKVREMLAALRGMKRPFSAAGSPNYRTMMGVGRAYNPESFKAALGEADRLSLSGRLSEYFRRQVMKGRTKAMA